MSIITCGRVLRITDSSIDQVRNKLGNHNEQVAYITYKLVMAMGNIDEDFVHLMCRTAYLHDIGCYKTGDKEELSVLDVIDPHKHTAYGYVFLKYFYRDGVDLSAIKYHHLPWNLKPDNGNKISDNAFIIHLADRIAIAASKDLDVLNFVNNNCGKLFAPEHVALFHKANKDNLLLDQLNNGHYCTEIHSFLSRFVLCDDDIFSMAKMMCYAMDFGSMVTVNHNILVTEITRKLAQLFSLPEDQVEDIANAASLHDIGKLVIPISIIEKTGKLTTEEFELMKYHAIAGYDILSTIGLNKFRDIASLHHEKIDGSGYPFGLKGDEISFPLRLVTVADILSALIAKRSYKEGMDKDTICSILTKMVNSNQIDADIVLKVIENFDDIIMHSKDAAEPVLSIYQNLDKEYKKELKGILELLK